jgi:hypothetical protein
MQMGAPHTPASDIDGSTKTISKYYIINTYMQAPTHTTTFYVPTIEC